MAGQGAGGRQPPATIFLVFLKLGLTSFGGPVAHIGYFREELVRRRGWLDERAYADLVALAQFLPGPASSQVGLGIGLAKGGMPGALLASLGFTLPSAILMVLFAYGVAGFGDLAGAGWLQGLKVVAVAVVALAVWGMATSLTPDAPRASLALAAAIVVLAVPGALGQITAIVAGGLVGLLLFRDAGEAGGAALGIEVPRRTGAILLLAFFVLLGGLPLLVLAWPAFLPALVESFFRAGALVFGGGHVVLPLLQAAVVPPGWVTNEAFLAGYGAAQALPGPLFTFAAYLGTIMRPGPLGWLLGVLATGVIFLPSFLLVIGALPFWDRLRAQPTMRAALRGVNAAVVGLLLAALYDPVWVSGVRGPGELGLGLAAFGLLALWKWPPWLVVLLSALAGAGLEQLGALAPIAPAATIPG
jgi:chromate transporter